MEATSKLYEIKRRFKSGIIPYSEAVRLAEPELKALNEKQKTISKKYKKNHSPITFSYFMR